MEAVQRTTAGDQPSVPRAIVPSRVLLALDHFTPEERTAVDHAAQAFARGLGPASRLPDAEPLYLLRATPTLLVIVRQEAGRPIVIEDVVTREAWDQLAHAV